MKISKKGLKASGGFLLVISSILAAIFLAIWFIGFAVDHNWNPFHFFLYAMGCLIIFGAIFSYIEGSK